MKNSYPFRRILKNLTFMI